MNETFHGDPITDYHSHQSRPYPNSNHQSQNPYLYYDVNHGNETGIGRNHNVNEDDGTGGVDHSIPQYQQNYNPDQQHEQQQDQAYGIRHNDVVETSNDNDNNNNNFYDDHDDHDDNDENDSPGNGHVEVGASHLDHALLESLFYNEMVMLEADRSSPLLLMGGSTPSDFISHHLAAATASATSSQHHHHDQDTTTIVEKEILRDFGVDGTTRAASSHCISTPQAQPGPSPAPPPPLGVRPWNPASTVSTGPPGHGNGLPPSAPAPVVPAQQSHLYQQHHPQHQIHNQQQQQQQTHPYSQVQYPPSHHQHQPQPQQYLVEHSYQYQQQQHQQQPLQSQQQQPSQYQYEHHHPTQTSHSLTVAAPTVQGLPSSLPLQYNDPLASSTSAPTMLAPATVAAGRGIISGRGGIKHSVVGPAASGGNHGTTPASLATARVPPIPPLQTVPSAEDDSDYDTAAAASIAAATSSLAGVVPQARARQLVDQFATLASRLGIDLPDTVLQSLTSAAARNDPTLNVGRKLVTTKTMTRKNGTGVFGSTSDQSSSASGRRSPPPVSVTATRSKDPVSTEERSGTTTAVERAPSDENNNVQDSNIPHSRNGVVTMQAYPEAELPVAPTVIELRRTAEEAIAAVTKKRSPERGSSFASAGSKHPSENDLEQDSDDDDDDDGGTGGTGNNSIRPTYSKRRKKPRLSDCESRLAQLQAENEQLKRHLQNVSNKAHKFDKEKEEAGRKIASLHLQNAANDELNQAVEQFTDMYSDYGVNRQQELNFHLEQLQRLVNPTNFTKMGLWTLGQSTHNPKKNPISGILVKELTITAQQGRKILDQSEKIRILCENLKETLALLAKLKALCEQKTRIFQDRMSKCKEILTSKQVVKLIMWVNEHTELLESVCPGWGTEHIHSKKPQAG